MKSTYAIAATKGITLIACFLALGFSGRGTLHKTFQTGKGGSLTVRISGGDIHIRTWEKNEVSADVQDGDEDESDGLEMTQQGNAIVISSSSDSPDDITLNITVPTHFDVQLSTSSGNITVDGPFTGSLGGNTSGGDIRLGNVGGTIHLTTSGGDIQTGDIQGQLGLHTSGGDIKLGTVSGDAEVGTSGGDITVRSVGKRLNAQTSGGNISIGDVGGSAIVSTAGGDIIVGTVAGSATLSTSGGNVSLQGATGTVHASTAGGDMTLENIGGSIDGSTAGGNIRAELHPGTSGKSRLTTASGDIALFLPANAKAKIIAHITISGWNRRGESEFGIRSDFRSSGPEQEKDEDEISATYILNGGGQEIIAGNNRREY